MPDDAGFSRRIPEPSWTVVSVMTSWQLEGGCSLAKERWNPEIGHKMADAASPRLARWRFLARFVRWCEFPGKMALVVPYTGIGNRLTDLLPYASWSSQRLCNVRRSIFWLQGVTDHGFRGILPVTTVLYLELCLSTKRPALQVFLCSVYSDSFSTKSRHTAQPPTPNNP